MLFSLRTLTTKTIPLLGIRTLRFKSDAGHQLWNVDYEENPGRIYRIIFIGFQLPKISSFKLKNPYKIRYSITGHLIRSKTA